VLVFFDIGSTLIDGPPMGPGRRIVNALGLPPSATPEINALVFRTPVEAAGQLAEEMTARFGVDSETAHEVVGEIWRAQLEEAYVLPGALEAVAALKDAGIDRAYISNIWAPFYARFEQEFVEEVQSQPQFLSFRTGLMKPDLEFYQHALGAVTVSPSDIVMVGDTYENDIAPAIALGMKTIWLLHRPEKERCDLARILNGEAPAPDLTLCSIADLAPETIRSVVNTTKPFL
jgi:HAD superfamily hydrolase (TIGR01509 family)